MDYNITREDGTVVASFKYESDRDYCIETLRDIYDDDYEFYCT